MVCSVKIIRTNKQLCGWCLQYWHKFHGEFNTFVNYPDLWSKDGGYFLKNTELFHLNDLLWERDSFPKKHSKISIMPTPNSFQSDHKLHTWKEHKQWTAVPQQFATLIWTRNNLSAKLQQLALGFRVFWPDNALGFGTRVRTFVALFSSLDLKNSSQTSYHKSFCSKSWHPYGSAIGSSHAMVSQCQLLSSPNSKQNTAVKIPPLCCRCSFTQAV